MSILINIASIVIGVLLIAYVISLMVKRKLIESQSIMWIGIGLAIIIIGIWPPLIPRIAEFLGIWYPPTILFLIAFVGLLLITFKNTMMISMQDDKIHELSMQVALLKDELENLRNNER